MEPNTQTSSPSPEVIPQEEAPVYHTISGGPETLQQIQEEKAKEIVQSVPEIVPQPAQQVEVQTVSSNQTQQISPSFNSINIESIMPQEAPQGKSGVNIGLAINSILISILYFPVWSLLSAYIVGGSKVLRYVVIFIMILFSSYMYYLRLQKKATRDAQLSVEENAKTRRDILIILTTYVVFLGSTFILVEMYGINNIFNDTPVMLFFSLYVLLALVLLFMSIKNIKERKSYVMLGQFFIFLFSPLLIGFGLCILAITGGLSNGFR
jgi:hypothetical protein